VDTTEGQSFARFSTIPPPPASTEGDGRLLRASSLDAFARAPVGHGFSGQCYMLWATQASLIGGAFFGRAEERDVRALGRLIDIVGQLRTSPRIVIDMERVTGLSAGAFDATAAVFESFAGIGDAIGRIAVVRPRGMLGAAIGGLFHDTFHARTASSLFADRLQAFEWVEPMGSAYVDVEHAIEQHGAVSPLLRGLRSHLTESLPTTSVGRAARVLGVSVRSLQRKLAMADTSFREEVVRARIAAASLLLSEQTSKVDTVARAVGCSSLAHFSMMFRRATGQTPTEYRATQRQARVNEQLRRIRSGEA
jgi:AraC-like DNA-binding protein